MTGSARTSFARLLMVTFAPPAAILGGCDSEEPTIVEPPPPSFACELGIPSGGELPAPTPIARPDSLVRVTRSFGDSPVEGFVVVEPRDSGEWAVDLDGDGAPEATGALEDGAEVPYRYTNVGVHEIRVRLRDGGVEREIALRVVVNDPTATVVEEVVPDLTFGGVTVTPDGHEVWTGVFSEPEVVRFSASDLAVRERISIVTSEVPVSESWTSTPNGSRVLFATRSATLYIFDRQDPRNDQKAIQIDPGFQHTHFVQALTADEILVGSHEGIALLDVDTCEFDRFVEMELDQAGHFTVDGNSSTVAVLEKPAHESWGVVLLDLPGLEVLRRLSIQDTGIPIAVVFGPDEETLFIAVEGFGERPDELFVMHPRSGEIEAVHALPMNPGTVALGVGNPATLSHDGRFAVFPSAFGAYFIDTARRIPLYRAEPTSCCMVAASPLENLFFFSGAGRLSRVRLTR